MKKLKNGISLIVLVITIIVMSILAGSVLIALNDTNIISKANAAVNDYNKKQNDILSMLESVEDYINGIEDDDKPVIDTQGTVGVNGEVTLPILLNDTSKIYVLDIQSSLYSGKVALNVYNFDGSFFSVAGLTTATAYPTEIRHILMTQLNSNTNSTEETGTEGTTEQLTFEQMLDELFGTSGIVPIAYESDGTAGRLVYDAASVGSEIRVNSISEIDREYTNFAKLILKLVENGKLTASDYAECIRFCVNSGTLGYTYVNTMFEENSGGQTYDETLEIQTLTDILNNRMSDVAMLEQTITDQVVIGIYNYLENLTSNGLSIPFGDMNTFVNYFQENEYLNEFNIRTIGNTFVPFTLLYSDLILRDLNEDGVLGGTYQAAVQELAQYLPDTGHAGVAVRNFADAFCLLYPIMLEEENGIEGLPILDQFKVQELSIALMGTAGAEPTPEKVTCLLPWLLAYELYGVKEMDTMYTLIHDTGATINLAGLKMGWNSIVSPELYEMLGLSYSYDLRNDTEALTKQQVSGIVNELYEYVEYSKTLPKETTESGTTE